MKVKFEIGDWSADGHGMSDTYIIDTEGTFDLEEDFARGVEVLGHDITKHCQDYEESYIPIEIANRLKDEQFNRVYNDWINGVLYFTWEIRNKRWAYKTDELTAITFVAGDKISCFAKEVGGGTGVAPNSVILDVVVRSTSSVTGEDGSSTL